MQKSYQWLLADLVRPFMGKVTLNTSGEIEIDWTKANGFNWKGKPLSWQNCFSSLVAAHPSLNFTNDRLTVAKSLKSKDFQKAYWALQMRLEAVAKENLNHPGI